MELSYRFYVFLYSPSCIQPYNFLTRPLAIPELNTTTLRRINVVRIEAKSTSHALSITCIRNSDYPVAIYTGYL